MVCEPEPDRLREQRPVRGSETEHCTSILSECAHTHITFPASFLYDTTIERARNRRDRGAVASEKNGQCERAEFSDCGVTGIWGRFLSSFFTAGKQQNLGSKGLLERA